MTKESYFRRVHFCPTTSKAQALSVLLPSKAKYFAQSTEQKSKTNLLDARLLCRLGLELLAWQPRRS